MRPAGSVPEPTRGSNVEPDTGSRSVLSRVRRLRGVTWEWADDRFRTDDRKRQMGVVAQDVQEVFPEAVVTDAEGNLRVDYNGLVGALVEAVKELAERVDGLEGASDPHRRSGSQ